MVRECRVDTAVFEPGINQQSKNCMIVEVFVCARSGYCKLTQPGKWLTLPQRLATPDLVSISSVLIIPNAIDATNECLLNVRPIELVIYRDLA